MLLLLNITSASPSASHACADEPYSKVCLGLYLLVCCEGRDGLAPGFAAAPGFVLLPAGRATALLLSDGAVAPLSGTDC